MTLEKYLKFCDFDSIKEIITRIINVLYHAYRKMMFTHYDLHLNNIMITIDPISGSPIPIIIDFEYSYINVPGSGRYLYGGKVDRMNCWFHDIFKMLAYIYVTLDTSRRINSYKEEYKNIFKQSQNYIYSASPLAVEKIIGRYGLIGTLCKNGIYHKEYILEEINNNNIRTTANRIIKSRLKSVIQNKVCDYVSKVLSYFRYQNIEDPRLYLNLIEKDNPYFSFWNNEMIGGSFDDFVTYYFKVYNTN